MKLRVAICRIWGGHGLILGREKKGANVDGSGLEAQDDELDTA